MSNFVCYDLDSTSDSVEAPRSRDILKGPRFPADAVDPDVWNDILRWLTQVNEETSPEEIDGQLERLRQSNTAGWQRLNCPCLFVSHRSVDAPLALAFGKLASSIGFDIWIDVLDPQLTALIPHPNSVQKALATALLVEVALLNCSHLLAVMTSSTAGSWWVPYEYGRIKERPLSASNIGAWFDTSFLTALPPSPSGPVIIPEYLYLGERLHSSLNVQAWLTNELTTWAKQRRIQINCPPKPWPHGRTVEIPGITRTMRRAFP
jgi:hypothetical protein